MISFQFSVIDIVLVIAVGVLTILFLSQKFGQSTSESESRPEDQEKPQEMQEQ